MATSPDPDPSDLSGSSSLLRTYKVRAEWLELTQQLMEKSMAYLAVVFTPVGQLYEAGAGWFFKQNSTLWEEKSFYKAGTVFSVFWSQTISFSFMLWWYEVGQKGH